MHRLAISSLLALAGMVGTSAHAEVVLLSPAPSQSVFTEATYTGGSVSQGYSSSSGGTFNQSASTSQSDGTSSISETASQTSTLPLVGGSSTTLSGMGNVGQVEHYPIGNTFADGGLSNSVYTINFTIGATDPGLYVLSGSLGLNLATASDIGQTYVTLTDTFIGVAIYQLRLTANGTNNFVAPIVLNSDDTYTLTSSTQIGRLQGATPSDGTSTGSWNFSLNPAAVPEPSSLMMGGLGGAIAMAYSYTCGRRKRSR